MIVFYISSSNRLACVLFSESVWSDCSSSQYPVGYLEVAHFTAASDSRHLSVEVNIDKSELQFFLLYEDTNNEVKVHVTSWINSTNYKNLWAWQDMTTTLHNEFAESNLERPFFTNTTLSAPFATITVPSNTKRTSIVFTEKNSNGSYTPRVLDFSWDTDSKKFIRC